MKESPKDKTRNKYPPHAREDGIATTDDNHEGRHDPDSTKSSGSFPPTRPHLHSKKVSTEVPVKATQMKKIPQKSTEVDIPNVTVRKTGFRANRRKVSAAQQSEEPVTRKSRHSHCLIPKEILPPLIRSISFPQNKSDFKKHGVVSSPRRSGGDQRHEIRFGVDKNRISQRVISSCRKITASAKTELSSCSPEKNEKKDGLSKENTMPAPLPLEKSFGDSRTKSTILTKSEGNVSSICTNQEKTSDLSTNVSKSIATKDRLSRENTKLQPLHLDKSTEESTTRSMILTKCGTDVPKTSTILSKSFEGSKSASVTTNATFNSLISADQNLDVPLHKWEKEHLPHLQLIPASRSQQAPPPIKETVKQIRSAPFMLEHVKYVPTMELASESRTTLPSPEEYVVKGKSIQSLSRNKSPLYSSLEELGKQRTSETPINLKRFVRGNFLEPLPAELGSDSIALNRNETNLNKLSVLGVGVLQTDQYSKEMTQSSKDGTVGLSSPETLPQKTASDKRKSPSSPLKDLYKFACKGVKFDLQGERIYTAMDEPVVVNQQQLFTEYKSHGSNQNDGHLGEAKSEDKDLEKTICSQVTSTRNDKINDAGNISPENVFTTSKKPEKYSIVDENAEAGICRCSDGGISSDMGLESFANDETRVIQEDGVIFTQPKIDGTDAAVASSPRCRRASDGDEKENNSKMHFVGSPSKNLERNDYLELSDVVESVMGSNLCQHDDKTINSDEEVSSNDDRFFGCPIKNSERSLNDSEGHDFHIEKEVRNHVIEKSQRHGVAGICTPRSENWNLPFDKTNVTDDVTEESSSSVNITDETFDSIGSLSATWGAFGEYENDERPKQDGAGHEEESFETLDGVDDGTVDDNVEIINGKEMLQTQEDNVGLETDEMEHSFRDKDGSSNGFDCSVTSFGGSPDKNMPKQFSDSVCLEGKEYGKEIVKFHVDCDLDSTTDDIVPPISEQASGEMIDYYDNKTACGKGSHLMHRSSRKRNMLPVILEGEYTHPSHLHSTDSCEVHRFQLDNKEEDYALSTTAAECDSLSSNRVIVGFDERGHNLESFVEEITKPGNIAVEAFSRACQNIWMAKSMGDLIQRKATLIMDRLYLKMESVGYTEDSTDHSHQSVLDSEEARNLEVETERFIRGLNTIFMTFHRIWVAENNFIRCCDDKVREKAENAVSSPAIVQDVEK